LISFLNGTSGCLEVLDLHDNDLLFGPTNNDQRESFYAALANHTTLRCLDVRLCGLSDEETDGPFQSAVLKNTSLVMVNGSKAEGIRSNTLMALIQSTMVSPTDVQFALWPKALGVCAPRLDQVGA
jgi:hypothetical protein